jgi:Zn-dependent protease with chaperone function
MEELSGWIAGAVLGLVDVAAQSPTAPVPVPEATPLALRFYWTGNVLWVVAQLVGLLIPLALLASGAGARVARWAERVGGRPLWAVPLAIATLTLAMAGLELPLDLYAGYVRPHAYGLSNQSPARWASHWAIGLGLTLGLWTACGSVVVALRRRSPERWWLWTGLLTLPLMVFLAVVQPVVIDPLFNDYGPLRDRALETRIRDLATRAGVGQSAIYQVDKSRDTKAVNAFVNGLFGTRRIVLWDTLLDRLEPDEVLVVMGHELGHYVKGHVFRGLAVAAVLTLVGLGLVHLLVRAWLRRRPGRWGITGGGDPAALLAVLIAGRLVFLLLVPVGYAHSRAMEREADRFGLEVTGMHRAGAMAFVKLQQSNLTNPRPGPLFRLWRSTHPSVAERVLFFNQRGMAAAESLDGPSANR